MKYYKILMLLVIILALSLMGVTVARIEVSAKNEKMSQATFAGGCFWCLQELFDKTPGVVATRVGYTGGSEKDPNYKDVSMGKTSHAEALRLTFDPNIVSYGQLLDIYWHNIDPLSLPQKGQFCDRGEQYRAEIFYHDIDQQRLASLYKMELNKSQRFNHSVSVRISPVEQFYDAEDYHQKYYKKNPILYKIYKFFCGRDKRLNQLWSEPQIELTLTH